MNRSTHRTALIAMTAAAILAIPAHGSNKEDGKSAADPFKLPGASEEWVAVTGDEPGVSLGKTIPITGDNLDQDREIGLCYDEHVDPIPWASPTDDHCDAY